MVQFELPEVISDLHLRRTAFDDRPFFFGEIVDAHLTVILRLDLAEAPHMGPRVEEGFFQIHWCTNQMVPAAGLGTTSPVTSQIFDLSFRVLETTGIPHLRRRRGI